MPSEPPKVVRLAERVRYEDIRFVGSSELSADGKTRAVVHWRDVEIGRIGVGKDGSVLFQDDEGIQLITAKQAREVANAFSQSAYRAEELCRELSGYNRILVVRLSGGGYHATYRNFSDRLRLSRVRRARYCDACKAPSYQLWVGAQVSDLVNLCEACVEKLANEPKTLREIPMEKDRGKKQ